MGIAEEIENQEVSALLAKEQAKTATARREREGAVQALKEMAGRVELLEKRAALIEGLADLVPRPPKWTTSKRNQHDRAIAYAPGSDWHLDEVVNPDEMSGVNAFNREIAQLRLERYYRKLAEMPEHFGLNWEGIVHGLNGDIFTGEIHEELKDTNEAPILASLLYWVEHVAAGIDLLADTYGKVHVPVTVGNHGRRSRRSRAKGRATDNFDWLFGHMVSREFKDDDRVTFQIPESFDVQFDIYETTIRQEHGDGFKGGNGIAGIFSPIARGHAKRQNTAMAIDQPFDLLSIGHFHQYINGPRWGINGSLKGFDEYAKIEGFGFEVPSQAFCVVTPKHGITWRGPIYVADPKAEGWQASATSRD